MESLLDNHSMLNALKIRDGLNISSFSEVKNYQNELSAQRKLKKIKDELYRSELYPMIQKLLDKAELKPDTAQFMANATEEEIVNLFKTNGLTIRGYMKKENENESNTTPAGRKAK